MAAAFGAYFPGDDWVDDAALDGYNYGPVHDTPWRSFDQVFQGSYNVLARLSTKPLMITETSSTEVGGSKADWIAGIPQALTLKMPRIRALIWFDVDKESDWSVSSSKSSLAAFRHIVTTGALSGQLRGLLG